MPRVIARNPVYPLLPKHWVWIAVTKVRGVAGDGMLYTGDARG